MLRLGLGAGVLLAALLFVADAYRNERQEGDDESSEGIMEQQDPKGLMEALLCKTPRPGTCE